ncbi:MAG: ATP-dependent 6-phosphofructokinase [Firmicutes bacterium]|nr:ATP-dependent 6-phosphofructokinase [Bacillota bacterium]
MHKRLGVLTGGGDAPGLNAVIRAVTRSALRQGWEAIGFLDGYAGLISNRTVGLTSNYISGLLHRGGTILGSNNRDNPFHFPVQTESGLKYKDMSDQAVANLDRNKVDCLIAIGGDGSLAIAHELGQKGARIIGVPKTIDNDLLATDQTFGFDTAVATATDALDKLHTTAESHHRVMVLELMGRHAGWIALASGIAGGADVILIPEIPWHLDSILAKIQQRRNEGKHFSIVVVAEGVPDPTGKSVYRREIPGAHHRFRLGGIGAIIAGLIEQATGIECRATVLGHLQRGGSPSAFDRILATRYGVMAAQLAMSGQHGLMVCLKGQEIEAVPIHLVARGTRPVPTEGQLVQTARALGLCLGD